MSETQTQANLISNPAQNSSGDSAANAVANSSAQQQSSVDNRENEFLQKFGMLSKREQQLRAKEMELEQKASNIHNSAELEKMARENPMGFLEKFGLSYGKLTEIALGGGVNPAPEFDEIKKKVSEIETEFKSDLQKRRENEEKAALVTVMGDIRKSVSDSEDFELIRAYEAFDEVWELMVMHFNEHKQWLPIETAAREIEKEYRARAEKLVSTKFLSSKMQQSTGATDTSQSGSQGAQGAATDPKSGMERALELAKQSLNSRQSQTVRTLSNGMSPQATQGQGNGSTGPISEETLRERALAAFRNAKG